MELLISICIAELSQNSLVEDNQRKHPHHTCLPEAIFNMIFFLLLLLPLSAVLGQDASLPSLPEDFSATFMGSEKGKGNNKPQVFVGSVHFSKEKNIGAFVVKKTQYTEHLVFNYNTKEVLVTNERTAKNCDILKIDNFAGLYNPKTMIAELTSKNLKPVPQGTSLHTIPTNSWAGTSGDGNNTISVSFSAPNWTFANGYSPRPVFINSHVKSDDSLIEAFYFMDAAKSVPPEAFMPPAGIFCPTFNETSVPPPTLPESFTVDVEEYKENENFGSIVYYNGEAKVLREDVVTDHVNMGSLITDRYYKIVYKIDESGACSTLPLLVSDEGATKNMVLFENQDLKNFKYIGNRTCWQGSCEVWSGAENGILHNIYLKYLRQTVDGVVKESYTPVQMDTTWKPESQDESTTTHQYYFNFVPGLPDWKKFDVTSCYGRYVMRIQIKLRGPYLAIKSIPDFLYKVSFAIRQRAAIPEMRMHQFRVDNVGNELVIVTFTLVDDPRAAKLNGSFTFYEPPYLANYIIFNRLSNQIRSLAVVTKAVNGSEMTLYGHSITRNVLSVDKIDGKGYSLAKFKPRYHSTLETAATDTEISGLETVDGCARHCDLQHNTMCNMFMFCHDTRSCVISSSIIEDRPDKHFSSNCDLYTRQFAMNYQLHYGFRLAIDEKTDSSISDASLESCFADCYKKENGSCHSIDYCTNGTRHSCMFHAKHYSQQPRVVYDAQCLHYSQKFLSMYQTVPNKAIKDASNRFVSINYDVSAVDCAKNCFLDPSGCVDFEMCKFPGTMMKTLCHIMVPKNPDLINQPMEFVDDSNCDHFRLKGARTKFVFEPVVTDKSTDPDATPSAEKSTSGGGGYSPGSMWALGIMMFLITGFAAAGAIYYYVKREQARGHDDNVILKFVKE